jgi:hypothetical protein
MDAQADQMERIDQLGQEMRGRMTRLQDSVGGLLDRHWHTALMHIEEASRRPPEARRQELELASEQLFEAWGVAKALLDRDPCSMDPAALKGPTIAQQIAAVYQFMGEPDSTRRWLANAYVASRDQLDAQVGAVHDIFLEKIKHVITSRYVRTPYPYLDIKLWTTVYPSRDLLWNRWPASLLDKDPFEPPSFKQAQIARDPDLEKRLMALVELDGEAQLLRRTCRKAGINKASLAKSSRSALTTTPGGSIFGGEVHLVFDSATRLIIQPDMVLGPGHRKDSVPSPLDRKLNKRYFQLPWPPRYGPDSFPLSTGLFDDPQSPYG